MTFEVQQTRWDRMIRRVSGSIGPGSRVSETLSELFPVFDVEQAPAELLVLGGTRMAMGFTSEAGVAAVFQHSELFNPVGSGNLIVLHSLSVVTDDAFGVGMGLIDGSFLTNNPDNVGFVDGRLFGDPVPVGQCRDETAGAVGPEHYKIGPDMLAVTLFAPPKAVAVLSPGIGFQVHTLIVDKTLICNYTWTERPAEESELSL